MTNKRLNLKKLSEEYYELSDQDKLNMVDRVKSAVKRKKNVLTEMMKIVEKKVKHYQADFYIHDVQQLHKNPENSLIWFVRDSGTHFIDLDSPVALSDGESSNLNYFNALIKTNRFIGIYLVNPIENTLQKVSEEKAETIIKSEFEKAVKHYSKLNQAS